MCMSTGRWTAEWVIFPLFVCLLVGCDAAGPNDDRTIEGVDFDRLFAPPTAAELEVVERDWARRDVSVRGYTVVDTMQARLAGVSSEVRIVSHTVDGRRHYGAVLAPAGAAPGSLPVLVYLHGGDGGVSLDEVMLVLGIAPALARSFVVVVPSFRSEPLRLGAAVYASEGPPSPWDGDVDDALALVNVALATTPAADAGRVGVLGFSRGATVGMLMAIRDPRIDQVVAFFGPTDLLGTFAQDVVADALRGRPRDLPGLDYLDAAYIQPLKAGDLSIAEARLELLRRSPRYFARHLPQLQLHHGTADPVVPASEARSLDEALRALGRTAPDYEFYLYEGGVHTPLSLAGSLERTADFLQRLLVVA